MPLNYKNFSIIFELNWETLYWYGWIWFQAVFMPYKELLPINACLFKLKQLCQLSIDKVNHYHISYNHFY